MAKKGVKSRFKKDIFKKQKTIPKPTKLTAPKKPVSFSKTKTPQSFQTPVNLSHQQKQMYYWAIFFYGALILLILLGVLLLVKYGEDLAGKAWSVNYLQDNKVEIKNINVGTTAGFLFNEKEYKLKVEQVVNNKVAVNIFEYIAPPLTGTTEEIVLPYIQTFDENDICTINNDGTNKLLDNVIDQWGVYFIGDSSIPQIDKDGNQIEITGENNWVCSNKGILGENLQTYHARFYFSPVFFNFFESVFATGLDMSQYSNGVTIQWNQEYNHGADTTQTITIGLYGFDNIWNKVSTLYEEILSEDIIGSKEVFLPSSQEVKRIGFSVKGVTSYYLDYYDIDNIHICEGKSPKIEISPLTTSLIFKDTSILTPITATDSDDSIQDTVTLSIVDQDKYNFVSIDANNNLAISPTKDTITDDYSIKIKASDGCLDTYTTVDFSVVSQADYIIFKPSEIKEQLVNGDTADNVIGLKKAIEDNSKTVQVIDDLNSLSQFTNVKALFVSLGTYGAKHLLTMKEVLILKDYLDNGGKLYLEGGDTFFSDPKTSILDYFKIKGVFDGDTQISGTLEGQHFLLEYNYDITTKYSLGNNFVDHIDKEFNTDAVVIQKGSKDGETFGTAVAYEDAIKLYRTIGSSVPFAGLVEQQGSKTKLELMAKYLEFFENGLPQLQCTQDSECDDKLPCTTDTCANNVCQYTAISNCIACEWDKPCTSNYACDKNSLVCLPIGGTEYASSSTVYNIDSTTPKITSIITITDMGIVNNVYAKLKIMHTWRGDLKITLTHQGKTITLKEKDIADSGDHWYYTYDLNKDVVVGSMNDFNGNPIEGDWTLEVEDLSPQANNGKFIGWSLFITPNGGQ